jgi:hypothetical protein
MTLPSPASEVISMNCFGLVHLRHLLTCFTCLAVLAAATAEGGTIYWNMESLSTPTSTSVSNLTVGTIGQSNSTTTGTSTSSASTGYTFVLNSATTSASGSNNLQFSARSGALNSGTSSYMAITLTPSLGYSGTVTGIGFGSRSTGSGPTTLSLRSSLDAFAAEVAGFVTATDSTWAYFTNTFSAPLAVASGSTLELRLYAANGSSANAGNWRLDDLQLQMVVVPEPTALALGLVGAAGAVLAVRRARSREANGRADPAAADR